jgi:demethylmenaquinone methyltransferase/2-methoxy-6-polyprenyl-1,4-benzoquinol methylase
MSDDVHRMFSRIAARYDRANRWMSFGSDEGVRRRAVALSRAAPGEAVLDCAAGTGDLTFKFRAAVGPRGRVVGTDFNDDMLAHARRKAAERGLDDIAWRVEDAQQLGFDDAEFDIVSIAYGIRNVDDAGRALAEMHRVLKPGGRLVVLEFGQPPKAMQPGFQLFNRVVIPLIGGFAGGDRDAYRYLQRSSAAFPYGEAFVAMLHASGDYASIEAVPVIFGVNWIYVATKSS